MKKIIEIIHQKNFKGYFIPVIKYYTYQVDPDSLFKKCFFSPLIQQSLQKFQFHRFNINSVRQILEKCETDRELADSLITYFKINEIDFVNSFVLSKMVTDKTICSINAIGADVKELITVALFRAFAAFSFQLKTFIINTLNNEKMENFPLECWNIAHYLMGFFMNVYEVEDDFLQLTELFFSGFVNLKTILNLNSENQLRKFLFTTVIASIPYSSHQYHLDFLIKVFKQWSDPNNYNEFFTYSHIFVKNLTQFIDDIDQKRYYEISILITSFLSKISKHSQDFSEDSYQFAMDCFEIMTSHGAFDEKILIPFSINIVFFITWLIKTIDIQQYIPVSEISSKPMKLKFYDKEEYFNNNTNVVLPINELMITSQHVHFFVVNQFNNFLKDNYEHQNVIFEQFSNQINSYEDKDQQILFVCMLYNGLLLTSKIYCCKILKEILSLKFEQSKLHLYFYKLFMRLIYNISIQSSENMDFIIETVFENIKTTKDFCYYLPFFNSIIQIENLQNVVDLSKSEYMHSLPKYLIRSQIFLNIKQTEEFYDNQCIQFYQIIAIRFPLLAFKSQFLQFITSLALRKDTYHVFIPCFEIGLNAFQKDPSVISSIIESIIQIMYSTSENDFLRSSSTELMNYLSNYKYFTSEIVKNLPLDFDKIAKIPLYTKDFHTYIYLINFLEKLFGNFPIEMKRFSSGNLFPNLKESFLFYNNFEVIKALFIFVQSNKSSLIQNRQALELLLDISVSEELELEIIRYLQNLCKTNSFNAFECFMANVIGYLLKRIHKEIFTKDCLELYYTISSAFFSNYSLQETIQALKPNEDGKIYSYYNKIINVLNQLISNDKSNIKINSYFHFNGLSGITGIKIDNQILHNNFHISFCFRIEKITNLKEPIMFIRSNESYFDFCASKDGYYFHTSSSSKKISKDIKENEWYSICLKIKHNKIFLESCISEEVAIFKTEIQNSSNILFGISDKDSFIGDISSIYMYKTVDIKKNVMYLQITPSTIEKYNFKGVTIPVYYRIKDVMKNEGIFNYIMPLFLLINHSSSDEEIKLLFQSLLELLGNLFRISENLQILFYKTGCPQLLFHFFYHLKRKSFTLFILDKIKELFDSICYQKLKHEFVRRFWLNIDLFKNFPFETQMYYFSKLFFVIKNQDSQFLKLDSIDFILYQIQNEDIEFNQSLLIFPNSKLDNTTNELDEDVKVQDKMKLISKKWNLLKTICDIYTPLQSLLSLMTIITYHPSTEIKLHACCLFEHIVEKNKDAIQAFFTIRKYSDFILIFSTCDDHVKVNCLNILYFLAKVNRNGLSNLIYKSIIYFKNIEVNEYLIWLVYKIMYDELYKTDDNGVITFPEFLPLFILFEVKFNQQNNEQIQKFYKKVNFDLLEFPGKFSIIFTNQGWIYFIMLFFLHQYNFSKEMLSHSIYQVLIYFIDNNDKENIDCIFNFIYGISLTFGIDFSKFFDNIFLGAIRMRATPMMIKYYIQNIFYQIVIDEKSDKLLTYDLLLNFETQKIPTDYYVSLRKESNPQLMKTLLITLKTIKDQQQQIELNDNLRISVKDLLEMLQDENSDLYNRLRNETEEYRVYMVPKYSKTMRIIINLLNDKVKLEPTINEYNLFIKAHSEQLNLIYLHDQKLTISFLRDISFNGGFWSMQNNDVKWKATTKFDSNGYNYIMKINMNYDQHLKASALRDSSDFSNISEAEQITPFKSLIDKTTELPQNASIFKTFKAIYRTLTRQYSGVIHLTTDFLFFDGFSDVENQNKDEKPVAKYFDLQLELIDFIFSRNYLHEDIGCEILTSYNQTYLFRFSSTAKRNEFFSIIKQLKKKVTRSNKFIEALKKACGGCVQTIPSIELIKKIKIVEAWRSGQINNFHYLFFLNILSGRSLNDPSQYPVYPWILKDYKSKSINLDDPEIYRDLSLPIGCLNKKRIENLLENMNEISDPNERCIYRTHYSNPASVIGFLIRLEPFSSLHLKLQDGKYDATDRIFFSIPSAYRSVTSENPDFRELIPEFFCQPHFLQNENQFNLGTRQNGKEVGDVKLPKWAKNAYSFIQIHRQALESDYVSLHLNQWIDLIFGYAQNSEEHLNVFHPFFYASCINSQDNEDPVQLMLKKDYCSNFGTIPLQLFNSPHPQKDIAIKITPFNTSYLTSLVIDNRVIYFSDKILITESTIYNFNKPESFSSQLSLPITHDMQICLNNTHLVAVQQNGTTANIYNISNSSMICEISIEAMIFCAEIDENLLFLGGSDCMIYVLTLNDQKMHSKIAYHTSPIISFDYNRSLDIMASIDDHHNLFMSTIQNHKFIYSFRVPCNIKDNHFVKILNIGLIIISASKPSSSKDFKSSLFFYDLCGKLLKTIQLNYHIKCLKTLIDSHQKGYCFVSTSNGSDKSELYVMDLTNIDLMIHYCGNFEPSFIDIVEYPKTILLLEKIDENSYVFKPIGFI